MSPNSRGGTMRRNWLDVVVDWALARRAPVWVLVVALVALEAAAFVGVSLDDGYTASELLRIGLSAFYLPAGFVTYGMARGRARRAFDAFAPSLRVDEAATAAARRALLEYSNVRAIAWFAIGGFVGISTVWGSDAQAVYLGDDLLEIVVLGTLGTFASYGTIIAAASFGVALLTRITRLHRQAVHIDIYRTGPAHAFADVTSSIAVAFLVIVSFSAATDPATFATPISTGLFATFVLLAVVVFAAPLVGMRTRLRAEKAARRDRVLALLDEVEGRIRDDAERAKFAGVGDARVAAGALREDLARVEAASTWPWEARAVRTVTSSLLLPLATWLVTAGLGRLLNL